MEKYFYLEESPYYQNKLVIRMDHDKFLFPKGTTGSYNVFPARLMGLSYAWYLRFCRDRLGAELVGRNNKYVMPYFDDTPTVRSFVRNLNIRMKYIMNEQNFPYTYEEDEEGNITRIPFDQNENNDK